MGEKPTGRVLPGRSQQYLRGPAQRITFPTLISEKEIIMVVAPLIPEHMEVVSSDGQHGNHVDRVEGGRIKLAKRLPVLAISVALSARCCGRRGMFAQGPRQDQAPRSGQAALPGPSDDLLAKLGHLQGHPRQSRTRDAGAPNVALPPIGFASTDTRSQTRSAALAWSGFCATARARRCCCAPTWTRCP